MSTTSTPGRAAAAFSSPQLGVRHRVPVMPQVPSTACTSLEHGAKWIEVIIDFYLGYKKRTCQLGASCALQSLSPDVQRADAEIKITFETEANRVALAIAGDLSDATAEARLERAWALLSVLSGAVTLARSVEGPSAGQAIAAMARSAALRSSVADA